jgi:hypothetical protein
MSGTRPIMGLLGKDALQSQKHLIFDAYFAGAQQPD